MFRIVVCYSIALAILPASVHAATYTVRPDGSGDYPTIQAAINAAFDEDIIELTDGTFTGGGNRDIDFLDKAITVRSQNGDPEICVIDCEGLGRGFWFHSGEDSSSVLQDVTITNGVPTTDGFGAGILCDGASPRILECTILNNVADQHGGGMYCSNGGSPTLKGCAFRDNVASANGGGFACTESSAPIFSNCTFTGNSAAINGGGIRCAEYSVCSLDSCEFTGNTAGDAGGAIHFRGGSQFTITASVFVDNTADQYGGAIWCDVDTQLDLSASTFAGNTALRGGAMHCDLSSQLLIEDCLFSGNSATEQGGAMKCKNQSGPILTRCTFEDNFVTNGHGGALVCGDDSPPTITECDFDGNSATTHGGAVSCYNSSSPFCLSCRFTGNSTGEYGGAVQTTSAAQARFEYCTFNGNTADERGGALHCLETALELFNCTLYGNASLDGGGVFCDVGSATLGNCILAFGTSGGSFGHSGSGNPDLSCCDIYGNEGGDWVGWIESYQDQYGNISEDPLFCDPEAHDFTLWEGSPCAPFTFPNTDCDLIGAWPVGCGPATYLVHPDGSGDFPTIQAAIDAALDEDTIELTDGSFTGDGNRNIDYLGKAITVHSLSGNPEACIIDVQYEGRAFIFQSAEDSTSVLDGVGIKNGYVIADGYGGGIRCSDGQPTVRNCRFTNCVAASAGGAVQLLTGSLVLHNCIFTENVSFINGGAFDGSGGTSISCYDCQFIGNTASDGGAVWCASGTFSGCLFSANTANGSVGGGIYSGQPAFVTGCEFVSNQALAANSKGGAVFANSGGWIENCLFSESTADAGGALYLDGDTAIATTLFLGNVAGGTGGDVRIIGDLDVSGSTFAGSVAGGGSGGGAAIYCRYNSGTVVGCTFYGGAANAYFDLHDSEPIIRNTIIAFSVNGGDMVGSYSTPTLTCCNIYGNQNGDWSSLIADQYGLAGNISLDPWFCTPEDGDFHLHEDSPCVAYSEPNPECDQIGAWPAGCFPMRIEPEYGLPETPSLTLRSENPTSGGRVVVETNVGVEGSAGDLSIFDAAGRKVAMLHRGELAQGSATYEWNGEGPDGRPVPTGLYYARLQTAASRFTRSLVLIR